MGKELNEAARAAIEAALASMQELADDAELSQATVGRWHTGAAGVGPDSALRLASVLKARAVRLLERAAELEALARTEKGGAE